MATKKDFSEPEWEALRKGAVGAGMLVSLSDRDFTDSFGEAGAIARFLASQKTTAASELIRGIADGGNPFGFTASPERVRDETMESLRSSMTTLQAKAPDEVEPYRQLVLGMAAAAAEAKGGETPPETTMIAQIREAVGEGVSPG